MNLEAYNHPSPNPLSPFTSLDYSIKSQTTEKGKISAVKEDVNMPVEKIVKLPVVKPIHVEVNRTRDVEEQRTSLPIFYEEFQIISTIKENLVTILCGETGR
jgi:HrpA-like RNA helicase